MVGPEIGPLGVVGQLEVLDDEEAPRPEALVEEDLEGGELLLVRVATVVNDDVLVRRKDERTGDAEDWILESCTPLYEGLTLHITNLGSGVNMQVESIRGSAVRNTQIVHVCTHYRKMTHKLPPRGPDPSPQVLRIGLVPPVQRHVPQALVRTRPGLEARLVHVSKVEAGPGQVLPPEEGRGSRGVLVEHIAA